MQHYNPEQVDTHFDKIHCVETKIPTHAVPSEEAIKANNDYWRKMGFIDDTNAAKKQVGTLSITSPKCHYSLDLDTAEQCNIAVGKRINIGDPNNCTITRICSHYVEQDVKLANLAEIDRKIADWALIEEASEQKINESMQKLIDVEAKLATIGTENIRTIEDRISLLEQKFGASNDRVPDAIIGEPIINDNILHFIDDDIRCGGSDSSNDSNDSNDSSDDDSSDDNSNDDINNDRTAKYPLGRYNADKYVDYKNIFDKDHIKKSAAELTIFTEAAENIFFLPFVAKFARLMKVRGNIYAELIAPSDDFIEPFKGADYDAMKLAATYYFKVYFREDATADSSDIVFVTRTRGRKVEFARLAYLDYSYRATDCDVNVTGYNEDSVITVAFAGVNFCGVRV